jgi:hypothetical protein
VEVLGVEWWVASGCLVAVAAAFGLVLREVAADRAAPSAAEVAVLLVVGAAVGGVLAGSFAFAAVDDAAGGRCPSAEQPADC